MEELKKRMLDSAKKGNKRAGQSDLIKHLNDKRLTQRQAIRAKCYDCNGMGESNTCEIKECSLLPYSQYKLKAVLGAGSLRTSDETGV